MTYASKHYARVACAAAVLTALALPAWADTETLDLSAGGAPAVDDLAVTAIENAGVSGLERSALPQTTDAMLDSPSANLESPVVSIDRAAFRHELHAAVVSASLALKPASKRRTYALLLAGLGFIGFVARRRSRALSAAG
jgi:hypothetical protein